MSRRISSLVYARRRRSARARRRHTIRFSTALVLSTLGFNWVGIRGGSLQPEIDARLERAATRASAVLEPLEGAGVDLDLAHADPTIPAVVLPMTGGRDREAGARTNGVGERVLQTVEARRMAIPVPVRERLTADLPEGERREVSAGRPGALHVVDRVTWVDGVPEERVRLIERMVVAPEPRIIEIGTGPVEEEDDGEAGGSVPSLDGQTGGASWYVFGDELTAAHRTLPKGTIVTVTNLANGKSVKVRINDRGPYVPGRVIDLNKVAFAQIASVSEGVIDVRITW